MGIADIADHFSTDHAERAIDFFFDLGRIERAEITRPATAGFELGIGFEQRCSATNAGVDAMFVMIPVASGESSLGRGVPGNLVFHRIEECAPFGVGFGHFFHLGSRLSMRCSGLTRSTAQSGSMPPSLPEALQRPIGKVNCAYDEQLTSRRA